MSLATQQGSIASHVAAKQLRSSQYVGDIAASYLPKRLSLSQTLSLSITWKTRVPKVICWCTAQARFPISRGMPKAQQASYSWVKHLSVRILICLYEGLYSG